MKSDVPFQSSKLGSASRSPLRHPARASTEALLNPHHLHSHHPPVLPMKPFRAIHTMSSRRALRPALNSLQQLASAAAIRQSSIATPRSTFPQTAPAARPGLAAAAPFVRTGRWYSQQTESKIWSFEDVCRKKEAGIAGASRRV